MQTLFFPRLIYCVLALLGLDDIRQLNLQPLRQSFQNPFGFLLGIHQRAFVPDPTPLDLVLWRARRESTICTSLVVTVLNLESPPFLVDRGGLALPARVLGTISMAWLACWLPMGLWAALIFAYET